MKTTLTIDEAGRLEIPEELRGRLSFNPGTKVECEDIAGKLEVRRLADEANEDDYVIVEKDGILVVTGTGPTPGGIAKAVRDERDAMADRSLRTR